MGRGRWLAALCAGAATACSLLVDTSDLGGEASADAATNTVDAPAARDASSDASVDASVDADAGSRYVEAVLQDKPVAYFRLGGTALDSAARDETTQTSGQQAGSAFSGAPGALFGDTNTAVRFDDGFFRFGDVHDFTGKVAFSIEAWIEPTTAPVDYWTIVGKAEVVDAAIGSWGWVLGVTQSSGLGVYVARSDGVTSDFLQSAVVPPVGVFTHVVAVFDGLNQRIYIDGVLKNTFGRDVSLPNTPAELRIGRGFGSANGFRGAIDEVALYDSVLSPSRIAVHHAIGSRGAP
jgi:hypothetical protein